jgi:hypothetical protein
MKEFKKGNRVRVKPKYRTANKYNRAGIIEAIIPGSQFPLLVHFEGGSKGIYKSHELEKV